MGKFSRNVGTLVAASMLAIAGQAAAQQGQPSNLDAYDKLSTQRSDGRLHDAATFASLWRQEPEVQGSAYHSAKVFADCAGNSTGSLMEKTLAAPLSSPKEDEALRRLTDRSRACAMSGTAVPREYLRGAFAEEIMGSKEAGDVPLFADDVTPDQLNAFLASDLSGAKGDELGNKLHRIAACHAALAPGMAHKVLATEPGSEEEMTSMKNLFRAESRCGVSEFPEGLSFVLQRAFLADMLYQWGEFKPAKGG